MATPRLLMTAARPGVGEAIWAIPGSIAALAASYLYGARKDRARGVVRY